METFEGRLTAGPLRVRRITAAATRSLRQCTPAMGFYARLGFTAVGEKFVVSHSGPHYVMARPVDRA